MSWEIVAGIITLVGFIISTGTIIAKLSGTLSKLQTTLASLNDLLSELKANNNEEHKTFLQNIADLDKRVRELEIVCYNLQHN